jgi:hypothetical protein
VIGQEALERSDGENRRRARLIAFAKTLADYVQTLKELANLSDGGI